MATIINFFLKFYIVFFLFASSAHAADYKKLFSFPSINVEKSPYINLIFLDGSPEGYLNLPPNVYHRYKKIDPFSDEKEYKNTHVHCEIKVLFSNISGEKIGIKDALYGAIDLKLILNNGFNNIMGGFIFPGADSIMMKKESARFVTISDQSGIEFNSKNAADEFIKAGGCNFESKIEKVDVRFMNGFVKTVSDKDWDLLLQRTEIGILNN